MTKSHFGLIGAAAVLAFGLSAPASAHPTQHDNDHAQLDAEHGDVHDQLQDEHAEAHEQGLTGWEHRQLHNVLDNQHAQADYAIALQHQREHTRAQWQGQSRNQWGARYYGRHNNRSRNYYNQYRGYYGY